MPRRNKNDLIDVPEDVLEKLDIRLVTEVDEALRVTLPR
jgi:ATP-dependent Lon protease